MEGELAPRIEALEALAKGTLPGAPLDTLLGVSLDDDSSMIERDGDVRAELRRVTVALNQAERTQTKSEAELQLMRDQILALELERKVLALPIEVRERLVEESFEARTPKDTDSAAPKEEVAVSNAPLAAPAIPEVKPRRPPAARKPPAGLASPWLLSSWLTFFALLLLVFGSAHVVRLTTEKSSKGMIDSRRAQWGVWIQLGICGAGLLAAVLLSFRLRAEITALVVGALLLLAVLASKDVVASLVGGLVLFVRGPFGVGHRIEIVGLEGRVAEMGLLSVRLLNAQQRSIDIPNSAFLTSHVSASPASALLAPIQVDFYLRPEEDPAPTKRVILDVVHATQGVDSSEGRDPVVFVSQIPANGKVMTRLRTKVYLSGTHPEQEVASVISERVLALLRNSANEGAPLPSENETPRAPPRTKAKAVEH